MNSRKHWWNESVVGSRKAGFVGAIIVLVLILVAIILLFNSFGGN